MWNQGAGVYALRTRLKGHLNGHIHAEANESWGLDLDSVYGDLEVWQEGNFYGATDPIAAYRIQSRLRNCESGLTFYGQTLDDLGLSFDMDDASCVGVVIKREEIDSARLEALETYDLGLPAMGDNASFINTFWDLGYRPTVVRDAQTLHLDVIAGTYSHSAVGTPWIELFPTDLANVEFDESDWFEFVFSIELDGDAGGFFYGLRNSGYATFAIQAQEGPLAGVASVGYWMPLKSGGKKTFCYRARANSTDTGARLFWYIPNLNALGGTLPTVAHRMSITNIRACRIPG